MAFQIAIRIRKAILGRCKVEEIINIEPDFKETTEKEVQNTS
jgi:hypothetical protein